MPTTSQNILDDDEDFLINAFTRSTTSPRPSYAFQDPENISREMSQIPLFMTELPKDAKSNIRLQALQELLYEGTPEEVAKNFKEQGNERYREAISEKDQGKRTSLCKDAIIFYGKRLEQNDITSELRCALLLNRAAVNMILQNYGSVKRDCLEVLKMDSRNVKARMRLTKAYLSLGQVDEAERCLDEVDDENPNNLNERNELRNRIREEKARQKPKVTSPIDSALGSRGLIKCKDAEKHILFRTSLHGRHYICKYFIRWITHLPCHSILPTIW